MGDDYIVECEYISGLRARMKEVDKDSPEYQTSSDKFIVENRRRMAKWLIDIVEEYIFKLSSNKLNNKKGT